MHTSRWRVYSLELRAAILVQVKNVDWCGPQGPVGSGECRAAIPNKVQTTLHFPGTLEPLSRGPLTVPAVQQVNPCFPLVGVASLRQRSADVDH